jgi:hypothetical protein
LAHSHRTFSPKSLASGPVVRQKVMAVGACGTSSPPHREHEAEEREGPGIAFKSMFLVTYFLHHKLGTKPLTHEPVRTFHTQTVRLQIFRCYRNNKR